MDVNQWFWVWVALAAILLVAEIFTSGFFLLPFGIGAAVAALLEYLNVGIGWQWVAFLGVSAVLMVGLRRFADRITHASPEGVGVDRMLGARGLVIEDIDEHGTCGRVRIGSEEWRAVSETGTPLPAGTGIAVRRVEGARLIVTSAVADTNVGERTEPQP